MRGEEEGAWERRTILLEGGEWEPEVGNIVMSGESFGGYWTEREGEEEMDIDLDGVMAIL